MTIEDNLFLVSKIKKIKINSFNERKYLVKWSKSTSDTWEPECNFSEEVYTYPGYYQALNNIYRIRKKNEKVAIEVMSNYFNESN